MARAITAPAGARRADGRSGWVLVAGALAVVALQALALGPGVGLGWLARLLPLLAVLGLFLGLRVNPLRLDAGLECGEGGG